jgi:alkane 1-monooxygenase
MGVIRYLGAYVFLILGYFSLNTSGISTYTLVLFSFGVIPLVELILPESKSVNKPKTLWCYNAVLYSIVPLYLLLLYYFLTSISTESNTMSLIGKITAMGMLHGIYGINMAHELGHRKSKLDRFLAQFLLLTSQYTHFFIEHNRGHHKHIATPKDPATARRGENLYSFWLRTVTGSYSSAWSIENETQKRGSLKTYGWNNDMVKYSVLQVLLGASILLTFGGKVLICYLAACVFGILLLETINYIEHYGLLRKKINDVAYERVQHCHSWNSDHLLGRYLLFELTRHSHHHENSLTPYPKLQSKEESPQLPAGYPGMMMLSFFPPLFFKVMNKRLAQD